MREQGRPSAPKKSPAGMRVGLLRFASLAAVAAVPGVALAETEITDSRTTGVATATVANGAPDDIEVTANGKIDVSTGAAVTVNSDNDVLNSGTLGSEDDDDTTGILIQGPRVADITQDGVIELDETYEATDSDNDGDIDGVFADGSNRYGIWLTGGTLTGDISLGSTGRITIEGQDSAGVRLDSILDGDLTALGSISVFGDNSIGVDINSGVTGDVLIGGAITAQGANAQAVDIAGHVNGDVRIRGSLIATGFRSTARPSDADTLAKLDADDLLIGGAAVAVHASVDNGFLVDGTGVEDDEDDDGDGATETGADEDSTDDDDTDDDLGATIQSFGSGPAVLITTSGADTVLGALVDARGAFAGGLNYGFANRGAIIASGVYDDIDATAVRIEGLAGDAVIISGGVLNDGSISAGAVQADATALYLGTGVTAPTVLNRNTIVAANRTTETDSAYGVRIAAGADVTTFDNRGTIETQTNGAGGAAISFIDEAGTVDVVNNSGRISALGVPGDDETFTGSAVAVDVSANGGGVTLNQIGTIDFNDDDGESTGSRPNVEIVGDVRFGAGADVFNVLAGTVDGDVSFGAGADQLFIDGGARLTGIVSDTGGDLTIDVQDGELGLAGGSLNLTSATFGADSILRVSISSDPTESTFVNASGTVTFLDGALVTPVLIEGLPGDGSIVFLEAANLVGANFVEQTLTGQEGVPFIYNVEIGVSAGNANALEARYALKTAAELGLDANESAAFDSVIAALRTDTAASIAFATLDTQETFNDGYNDMLPNFSGASAELAITAIAQGQSASSNRLASMRLAGSDIDSAWIQEIAFSVDRDAPNDGVDYDGSGFGFAAGFDAPLSDGLYLGFSGAFSTSEVEEADREGTITANLGQINVYLGGGVGPLEWDLVAGAGAGQMKSDRQVAFGGFSATAESDWIAYEAHGLAQVGLPVRLGDRFTITPRANIVFIGLQEDGHEESGGGSAIDLEIGESTTTRGWADAALDLSYRFGSPDDFEFTPKLTVGYRANVLDDPAERDVRFLSGGTPFTLIDEEIGDGGPIAGFSLTGGNEATSVSLIYQGEFGDSIDRHSINAAVRFRF